MTSILDGLKSSGSSSHSSSSSSSFVDTSTDDDDDAEVAIVDNAGVSLVASCIGIDSPATTAMAHLFVSESEFIRKRRFKPRSNSLRHRLPLVDCCVRFLFCFFGLAARLLIFMGFCFFF